MSLTLDNSVLIGAILLFISIIVGKTSFKFGIPTLLFFLAVGMLAGSEGIGGIHFDNPVIAQFIGVISLNFILFSGGLETNWKGIKPVFREGIVLSTLGVLLTAVSLGMFIWWVTDLSIYESLLLGSIVSSTDVVAVFSILRSKNLALKSNLRPALELESGSNDPMAYVLTIAFLSLVKSPESGILTIIPMFLFQMIVGALAGYGFGLLSKLIINKIKLDYQGLYSVLVISLMFISYYLTSLIHGNGFLAIYIAAIYLGNQDIVHKKAIIQMFDGLAWLVQIVLFLTLGLLVFPSQILAVLGTGLLLSLFLIFIARPLSVLISLAPFKMQFRRRLYIAWAGLRGAVPIVFATFPLVAGVDKAPLIFNIVFIISVSSILIQGTTLSLIAKWLKVSLPASVKQITSTDLLLSEHRKAEMKEFYIQAGSPVISRKVVELGLPPNAIIAMIKRDNNYLIPNGSTVILEDDLLVILADREDSFDKMDQLF